jgi:glucosamine-phosphate N-acetyltransferase
MINTAPALVNFSHDFQTQLITPSCPSQYLQKSSPKMSPPSLLFPTSLISSKIQAELPEGYSIRPLQRDDYHRGHLEALGDLTHVGEILEEQWLERFDLMAGCEGTYYIIIITNKARGEAKEIVATGTLVAEKKLCVSCP